MAVIALAMLAPAALGGATGRILVYDHGAGSDWMAGLFRHTAEDFNADGWTAVEFEVQQIAPTALTYLYACDILFTPTGYVLEEEICLGRAFAGGNAVTIITGSSVTPRPWSGMLFVAASDDPDFRVAARITPSNSAGGSSINTSGAVQVAPVREGAGSQFAYVGQDGEGALLIRNAAYQESVEHEAALVALGRDVSAAARLIPEARSAFVLEWVAGVPIVSLGEHELMVEREGATSHFSGGDATVQRSYGSTGDPLGVAYTASWDGQVPGGIAPFLAAAVIPVDLSTLGES